MAEKSDYETGARKYPAKRDADASADFSQDAAGNRKPADGMGLSRPVNEVDDKTRQSDGENFGNSTAHPATEKTTGAGPAIAEHSKDANSAAAGRQPGAHVKE